jgi:hypothetical protein
MLKYRSLIKDRFDCLNQIIFGVWVGNININTLSLPNIVTTTVKADAIEQ